MRTSRLVSVLVAAGGLAAMPLAAVAGDALPADVVRGFNEAISRRDLAAAMPLLAKGSVQYTLRPAHAGVPANAGGGITSDLKAHWSQVGSLLFMVTTSYRREPVITNSRVEGDLATVWTKTSTATVGRDGKARTEQFGELYLLVHTADGWQIAAIADNRGTDSIPVNP